MTEAMFFLKTFAIAIALVLLMQIKVDHHTLETHAENWLHSSSVAYPIQAAAHGGAKLINDVMKSISGKINKNSKKKKLEPSQNETAEEESVD